MCSVLDITAATYAANILISWNSSDPVEQILFPELYYFPGIMETDH